MLKQVFIFNLYILQALGHTFNRINLLLHKKHIPYKSTLTCTRRILKAFKSMLYIGNLFFMKRRKINQCSSLGFLTFDSNFKHLPHPEVLQHEECRPRNLKASKYVQCMNKQKQNISTTPNFSL